MSFVTGSRSRFKLFERLKKKFTRTVFQRPVHMGYAVRQQLVNGLRNMVKRRCGKPKTTNSKHSFPVFKNLMSGFELKLSNEAWVSDITYIDTEEGFLYATLGQMGISGEL